MDNPLVGGMEESAGAVIKGCSVDKVFWKTENIQKNTCAGLYF